MGDLFGVSRSVGRDFMSALSNFHRVFLTVYFNGLSLALSYCDLSIIIYSCALGVMV